MNREQPTQHAEFKETYAEEGSTRGLAAIIIWVEEGSDAVSACRSKRTEVEGLWREAFTDEMLPPLRWSARLTT